jgi:hypothetical protein
MAPRQVLLKLFYHFPYGFDKGNFRKIVFSVTLRIFYHFPYDSLNRNFSLIKKLKPNRTVRYGGVRLHYGTLCKNPARALARPSTRLSARLPTCPPLWGHTSLLNSTQKRSCKLVALHSPDDLSSMLPLDSPRKSGSPAR